MPNPASVRQRVLQHVSPKVADTLFYVTKEGRRVDVPDYGTPHPDATNFPDHVLCWLEQADDQGAFWHWWYIVPRKDQDDYNWEFTKSDIGGTKFDAVKRTYVSLREGLDLTTPAPGAVMTNTPSAVFSGTFILADRREVRTDDPKIDSLFVIEERTYIKRVVMIQNDYDETFGGNLQSTQTLYYTGESVSASTAQRAGSSVTGTVVGLTAASQDFTFTGQPAEGNTIVVNSETWTFKELSNTLVTGATDVAVASVIARFSAEDALGVTLTDQGGGVILATADVVGTAGNAIAVGGTMAVGNSWSGAYLSGGGTVAATKAKLAVEMVVYTGETNIREDSLVIVDVYATGGYTQQSQFAWKATPSGDYEADIGATLSDSVDNMVTKINTALGSAFTATKVSVLTRTYIELECDTAGAAGNQHLFRSYFGYMSGGNLQGGADAYTAAASATLTLGATPAAGNTVIINGFTKTWVASVPETWVDIGSTVAETIANLLATATTVVPDGYTFTQPESLVIRATYGTEGTSGNAVGTTVTGTFGSWAAATMSGGTASGASTFTVTVVKTGGTTVSATDTVDGDTAASAADRARRALSTALGATYDVYGSDGEIWVGRRGTSAYTNDDALDVTITLGAGSTLSVVALSPTAGGSASSTIDAIFADDASPFWALQKTGSARSGEQLTASWFVVTEKQVVPAYMMEYGRGYNDTIDSITFPAVLDRLLTNIWPRKDGGSDVLVFPKYLRNAYGGPLRAEITETFHTLPVTPDECQSLQSTPIDVGSPIGSCHVPACLHGDVQVDQSTGTGHPVYRYTVASFGFSATNFTDWPKTFRASSSVGPLRGGYIKRNITIHRPSDTQLSPPT